MRTKRPNPWLLGMTVILRSAVADFVPRRLFANKLMGLVFQIKITIKGIGSYGKTVFV